MKFLKQLKKSRAPKVSPIQGNDALGFGNNEIFLKVRPFTMTSLQRVNCLVDSVNYIVDNNIDGDFVECGVWKGGSVMAMSHALLKRNITDKTIHLYDTFDGMSVPTETDEDLRGIKAAERLAKEDKLTSKGWAFSPLDEVKKNLASVGYPIEKFNFIAGRIEDTISENIPDRISLLRLDTDWYESTKVEMEYLFPRLVKGGVLIIDDYGHWKGCKKAVDEYFSKNKIQIFLASIDYTGRVAVKIDA